MMELFEGFYLWFMRFIIKIKTYKIYKTLPNEIFFEEILEIKVQRERNKSFKCHKNKFPKEILKF